MDLQQDKEWASKYLLDPLTAPQPSDETGPASHFTNTTSPRTASKLPALPATKAPAVATYPTPPGSASPTDSTFHPSNPYSPSHRQAAFGGYSGGESSRRSLDEPVRNEKGLRRGSSLRERFAGDMSHRPLEQLRKEAKAADRAPHLKKRHLPGADTVDALDKSMGVAYHHEGPYDATLLARNTSYKSSPVEAVRGTNAEALRATPRENIRDALDRHVPLQGTAVIPPGMSGLDGKLMQYEEGADLMREPDAPGGAYKRWADVKYLPEDYKGKGEPSFSIEKALKEHDQFAHRRVMSDGDSAYEMQPPRNKPGFSRQRSASGSHVDDAARSELASGNNLKYSEFESDMRRSNTTGRQVGERLKKSFGSLRRSKKTGKKTVEA